MIFVDNKYVYVKKSMYMRKICRWNWLHCDYKNPWVLNGWVMRGYHAWNWIHVTEHKEITTLEDRSVTIDVIDPCRPRPSVNRRNHRPWSKGLVTSFPRARCSRNTRWSEGARIITPMSMGTPVRRDKPTEINGIMMSFGQAMITEPLSEEGVVSTRDYPPHT